MTEGNSHSEELKRIGERLRTLSTLAIDFEQYTLLEEPLLRKNFVTKEIEFQQDALGLLLRRMRGEPKTNGGTETCPENATNSPSHADPGRANAPDLFSR